MPQFFSHIFNKSSHNSCSNSCSPSRASAASEFSYDPTLDHAHFKAMEKGLSGNDFLGVRDYMGPSYRRSRSVNSSSYSSRRSAIERNPNVLDNPPPPYDSNSDTIGSIHMAGTSSPGFARRSNTDYYRMPLRKESMENAYEILRKFNTVILVDDSYSMLGSRWREAGNALSQIAEIASQFDDDGIDIYFLNSQEYGCNMKSSEKVLSLFDRVQPSGATWLGQRLDCLLREYLNGLEEAKATKQLKKIKPTNYVVLTDGRPDDQLDLEKSIVDVARRLDQGNYPLTQVGIQLVQIGRSKKATEFLKELDDTLERRYHIRDIVDTTPYLGVSLSSDVLIKIMLGGISRKLDAMQVAQ